ncbi:GNAT family N-acetyltransferase [bacterium]|nr:GNAT family N-acetyltransferase [bacterium]
MLNPIHTERLIVHPLGMDDANALFQYRSDPDICRYQGWEPETVEEVQTFIAANLEKQPDTPGQWYQLGLYERDSGELVGDCGLHVLEDDPRQVEIGITLAPDVHGRGLATEALHAILGYLFNELGKHRVFGSVDPRNTASVALLERIGLRREAHFIESLWFKGEWVDDVIYAILKREYLAR